MIRASLEYREAISDQTWKTRFMCILHYLLQ